MALSKLSPNPLIYFFSMHPFSNFSVFMGKASENRKVFWCFQEVEKRCIGNEWVKLAPNLFCLNSNLNFELIFFLKLINFSFIRALNFVTYTAVLKI